MTAAAVKMGIENLAELYDKVLAFDEKLIGYLGWQRRDVPLGIARALLAALKEDYRPYIGDVNQVPLAKKAGIADLSTLYMLIDLFGFAGKLKYTRYNIPLENVEDFWADLFKWADENSVPYWRFLELMDGRSKEECRAVYETLTAYKLPETGLLLNDRHKSFMEVVAELKLSGFVEPNKWTIEPGEEQFALSYGKMTLAELEEAFVGLIGGRDPIIKGCTGLLHAPFPLIAFLDEIGGSGEKFERYVNGPIYMISALKNAYAYEQKSSFTLNEQRRQSYDREFTRAYQYKAFIRELIKRWGGQ
jgi:hypothetical protein